MVEGNLPHHHQIDKSNSMQNVSGGSGGGYAFTIGGRKDRQRSFGKGRGDDQERRFEA